MKTYILLLILFIMVLLNIDCTLSYGKSDKYSATPEDMALIENIFNKSPQHKGRQWQPIDNQVFEMKNIRVISATFLAKDKNIPEEEETINILLSVKKNNIISQRIKYGWNFSSLYPQKNDRFIITSFNGKEYAFLNFGNGLEHLDMIIVIDSHGDITSEVCGKTNSYLKFTISKDKEAITMSGFGAHQCEKNEADYEELKWMGNSIPIDGSWGGGIYRVFSLDDNGKLYEVRGNHDRKYFMDEAQDLVKWISSDEKILDGYDLKGTLISHMSELLSFGSVLEGIGDQKISRDYYESLPSKVKKKLSFDELIRIFKENGYTGFDN